jgi:hypothetical protein
MNERSFFSKGFVARCPVWVIVDLKRFNEGKGSDSVACALGRPGLGHFLPLFLSPKAAEEFAKELDWKGYGAFELKTARDLSKVISLVGVDNAALYLEKDKTRFYRAEDLLEELRSHLTN